MHIHTLVLGELDTNTYVLGCEKSGQSLIIDPADEGTAIVDFCLSKQLQPVALVLTHGHFDHCLAAFEVSLSFAIPVYLHSADLFLLQTIQSRAQHWLGRVTDPPPPLESIRFCDSMKSLNFGTESLSILYCPGHTPGSICLYNDESMFSGDTLFADQKGTATHSYSNSDQLTQSVRKLKSLPSRNGTRFLYPGHGEHGYVQTGMEQSHLPTELTLQSK